jgi:hypothetical protein
MIMPQLCTLGDALGQLSSDISSAFSIAFFELETIRTSAADLGAEVARLLAAAAHEGGGDGNTGSIEAFLQNATSAAEAAESAAGALTNRSFQGALVSVAGSLHEMRKCVLELASVSSLTKITQPQQGEISERLTVFTETLDSRCQELRDSAWRSSDLVGKIQHQSGLARDGLTAIGQEFRGISDGAGRQTRHLAELEAAHRAHMQAVGDDAGRLGTDVGRAVAELVGCLQFPDAFSQRVEHVRAALQAVDGASEAEAGAIAAVVAAQLRAMATALADVTDKANRALETLSAALRQSSVIGSRSEAIDPSDAWMDVSSRTNEAMLRSVARAREQLGTALALLAGLTGQIDTARTNLEASVRLNRELETSVHNASIVAIRSGSSNSPLRFLAGAVKDVVERTSGQIDRIATALMHIRETSEALGATSLESDLQTLLRIQEGAMQAGSEQEAMVEVVRETRENLLAHASRLTGSATAGAHAFRAAGEHAGALGDLAEKVQRIAPPDEPVSCDLGWLYALYTMEEERAVHRDVLGLPAAAADEASESADLDDFVL